MIINDVNTIMMMKTWDDYHYSIENGQLKMLNAGISFGTVGGISNTLYYNTAQSGQRRAFLTLKTASRSVVHASGTTIIENDTIYFPIPIPSNVTRITVSITPATQFHGEAFYVFNPDTQKYSRLSDPGWKQGSFTHTVSAGAYTFMTVTSKYNSAGTTYPDDPTNLSIDFSTT